MASLALLAACAAPAARVGIRQGLTAAFEAAVQETRELLADLPGGGHAAVGLVAAEQRHAMAQRRPVLVQVVAVVADHPDDHAIRDAEVRALRSDEPADRGHGVL